MPHTHIEIAPGNYAEALTITKPVTLSGRGAPNEVVISTTDATTVQIDAGDVRLEDVTISLHTARDDVRADTLSHDDRPHHYALAIAAGPAYIHACHLSSAVRSTVVVRGSGTEATIEDAALSDGAQAGVLVEDSAHATVRHCTIEAHAVAGLVVHQGAQLTAQNSTIRGGVRSIVVSDRAHATIEGCTLTDATDGISAWAETALVVRHCHIAVMAEDGIVCSNGSCAQIEECEVRDAAKVAVRVLGAGTAPTVRRCTLRRAPIGVLVNEDARATLTQCTISDMSGFGVFSRSARGVELDDCTLTDCKTGIGAESAGHLHATACTITGSHVIGMHLDGARAFLQTCTIRGSQTNGVRASNSEVFLQECIVTAANDTGIYLIKSTRSTLQRCEVCRNGACGVTVDDKSTAQISECSISRNGFSGGYAQVWIGHESDAQLARCTIAEGKSYGITVRHESHATIEDCEIRQNGSGGVWIGERAAPIMRWSTITANAGYGVTAERNCPAVIENCTLTDNKSGPWNLPVFGGKVRRSGNRDA